MAPVLGYWKIRGVAQPIRLLLEYTGTDFEDKYFAVGPAPHFDKSAWNDVRADLKLDFPNLPYYMDGNVRISQGTAIMRHIARKHGLCGSTEEEAIRVDILESQTTDFRNAFIRLCYLDFARAKTNYIDNLPAMLKQFSEFLGNRKWFAGENITFPDFIMYELVDQHLQLAPDCIRRFPNLQEFLKRFEELESIKKYMKSDRFLRGPINLAMAKWGNE